MSKSTRLCDRYLAIAEGGESAIVVSQTRAEVREINDAIRERLRLLRVQSECLLGSLPTPGWPPSYFRQPIRRKRSISVFLDQRFEIAQVLVDAILDRAAEA
jgi:hypothetical protein